MRIPRIYHPETLQASTCVQLSDNAAHHVTRVLRLATGAKITLFDGTGQDFHGTLTAVSKKSAEVTLNTVEAVATESPVQGHLIQAICRGEKMDWIIQKAVELGIHSITPIMTARSQLKWRPEQQQKKHQHWQNIIINSCEQCGRSTLPILNPKQNFSAHITQSSAGQKWILRPGAAHKTPTEITADHHPISFICGPEGGFSREEVEHATVNGYSAITLGPRILRAETAAMAFLSCMQWQWGDFQS